MGMGQKKYGLIMTLGGALTTFLAYKAMTGFADQADAELKAATEANTADAAKPLEGKGNIVSDEIGDHYNGPNTETSADIKPNSGVTTDDMGNQYITRPDGSTQLLDANGQVPASGQSYQAGDGNFYQNNANGIAERVATPSPNVEGMDKIGQFSNGDGTYTTQYVDHGAQQITEINHMMPEARFDSIQPASAPDPTTVISSPPSVSGVDLTNPSINPGAGYEWNGSQWVMRG
jgi:hypothetical protein